MTGKLLEDAVADFLASKTAKGITEKHIAKLKFELEQFASAMLAKGLVNIGDVRTEHVMAFRNGLKGAQNTRAKKVFRIIGFFEFAVEMGWINRNIARAEAVVIPYADDQTPRALNASQFATLMAAIPKVNGKTTDAQRAMLRALCMLMRWTGLAIRDACTIERVRFEPNGHGMTKLFLRRAKTGHPVYCLLKAEVVTEVFAGANPTGRYLFIDELPTTERGMDNLVKKFGDLMRKLGEVADLRDEHDAPYKFTSHALRHSFVLWALNAGMTTEDVAALIGDSVQITARHYSEWIGARQERLAERLTLALLADAK